MPKGENMSIKNGSRVRVNYKLTVDGKVIDTSEGDRPLEYTHGAREMIAGFERELTGMNKGDKKSFTLSPEDGYGPRSKDAFQKVPKEAFKEKADNLSVGTIIGVQASDGRNFQAIVSDIGDDDVTLDLNHPLAGKTLNFDVEILSVEEGKKEN